MARNILVMASESGAYTLSIPQSLVEKIHFADVDLVIRAKDGNNYVLPGAALAAMESKPPVIAFSDGSTTAADLLSIVEAVDDPTLNTQVKGSEAITGAKGKDTNNYQDSLQKLAAEREDFENQKREFEKLQSKMELQKDAVENPEKVLKELADTKEQVEAQDQQITETAARHSRAEAAAQMEERLEKITESLHAKDYDYVAPREYQPPPAPFSGPAGVPAPINMVPLVLLSMGNVVGTQTDTSTPGVTKIYGGGGADGSDSSAKIGPRDALQFSAASIVGTSGNDIIYAQGPLLGNANPAVDSSHYAKEFLLRVAGYFTELSDVVFKGLPSYVSVLGGTLQADGSWVLPSDVVVKQQAFQLVYDKDAWRPGNESSFSMTVVVSGLMRGTVFTSEEKFGFQFMDVTRVDQSTNPYLTFWDDGENKQIYILPTQDQPNTISAGAGDDVIYGGRNNDTIDAGTGNDVIWAYGGNNDITTGSGNNEVHTGGGDDIVRGGSGNDIIVDTGGANTIMTGDGTNQVTTGSGDDQITGGVGDDTIIAGDGINVVVAGDGVNIITTGVGSDFITTGIGDDVITAGDGVNLINAGSGNNVITTGTGNDTIITGDGNNTINASSGNNVLNLGSGDNTVTTLDGVDIITLGMGTNQVHAGDGNDFLYGGAGNDSLYGEGGDDLLRGALGVNVIDGGAGVNTTDYAGLNTAITVSLAAGTATGTGVSDTLTQIHNVIGSDHNDTISGNGSSNVLSGGAGNDTVSGGGGTDTLYGNDGNDNLTGGSGNDTIEGGAGADTINGGGAGVDILRGGDGDDVFTNPSMSTTYEGGAGIDKVDYSGQVVNLIIDLSAGTGYTGAAQMASYNSIEWIVAGSGSDTLTGGAGNDILDGGAGTDYLRGGAGVNTLIGGAGSNSYYYMGIGQDSIVANVGGWDQVEYYGSTAGVVVNLDSVAHSFVNTLGTTITVNALSGTSRGESAADTSSWSIGDTYTAGGVDYIYASNYNDCIYGSSANEQFMTQSGDDLLFAYGGNDLVYGNVGNDRIDGGDGIDRLTTSWYGNNVTVYMDGTADINGNGTADYLEKGATSMVGSGYTGFFSGLGGVSYFSNFEHIMSGTGADFMVGNANANEINAHAGNNTVYGMGGDDLIFSHIGNNTIDGGDGTDTISFRNEGYTGGHGYNSAVSTEIYLMDTDLDSNGAMDRAATWGSFTGFTARTNLSGTYSYSTVTNVENINGSVNADKIAGDANVNIIHGNAGNDFISGNGGADLLYGDDGTDTFVVASSDVSSVALLSGGTSTDTLRSAGWSFAANSFNNSAANTKFSSLEVVDVRNQVGGQSHGLNALDIQYIVDSGASSVLQLNLDSGDTFSVQIGAGTGALSSLNTTHTATDDVYKFYSDAGHTLDNSVNLVAIVNVHYGA